MIIYLRISEMLCGWWKLVVAPIGYRSFALCHCFFNLVLDGLYRSAIILLRKMAGCCTLTLNAPIAKKSSAFLVC